MRIIGGEYKGRIFQPGKSFKARPTTDFARENLFNILDNRFYFENKQVLDLFSGTGIISLEFASRGCKDVTLVEIDRNHFTFIYSVIEKLGLKNVVKPFNEDVFKIIGKLKKEFDIIFADPPYDLKRLDELPDLIMKGHLLSSGGVFILEHGKAYDFSGHNDFTELRKYGSVHFSFFQHNS